MPFRNGSPPGRTSSIRQCHHPGPPNKFEGIKNCNPHRAPASPKPLASPRAQLFRSQPLCRPTCGGFWRRRSISFPKNWVRQRKRPGDGCSGFHRHRCAAETFHQSDGCKAKDAKSAQQVSARSLAVQMILQSTDAEHAPPHFRRWCRCWFPSSKGDRLVLALTEREMAKPSALWTNC